MMAVILSFGHAAVINLQTPHWIKAGPGRLLSSWAGPGHFLPTGDGRVAFYP